MDQNTWNGLTGKEVREKIQNIESQVNKTDTTVKNLFNEEEKIKSKYLPSYVDDTVEGKFENNKFCPYDIENQEYSEPIEQGEKSKIYYDRENLISYRWSGSKYIEIVNGDEIQQRLNKFDTSKKGQDGTIEGVVNNKVGKREGYDLSKNDYTDDEKNKFTIVTTLPSTNYTDKVYYLKQDKNSYPKGLYYHNGTGWQRVGGLL